MAHGLIEETGAAQHMRDSRIRRDYEGANVIHAMISYSASCRSQEEKTVRNEIAQPAGGGDVAGRGRRFRRDGENDSPKSDALESNRRG